MTVILPPSDSDGFVALLKIMANPKEAEKRLTDLKRANDDLVKQQAALADKLRGAAELETRENRVAKREAEVAKREAELIAIARNLERREREFKRIGDELRAMQ
jgi:hypothetical protein